MQALLASPWHISGIYAFGGKRLFDLALVVVFAPLWLPVVALLWVMAWLEDGQGFYSDARIGRGGSAFRC